MYRTLVCCISVFAILSVSFSQNQPCGMTGTSSPSSQVGGRYKPSTGTFKVLVIYAQFSDDNTDISNPNWVQGQAPTFMNGTIDSTWSSNPTSGSMTDYFNQMSFNKLKIIGKTVSIIMPRSMQYYINWNITSTYEMNKRAIETADAQVNYAEFDNWTYNGEYSHSNVADGNVDMIFVVWRNSNPNLGLWSGLSHLNGYTTNYLPFTVEGGTKTIQTGFEVGSGVTIVNGYTGFGNVLRWMNHELGHRFFGGNNHHGTLGTWALLDGSGTPSGCINTYEREKLGWINVYTIDPASYSDPTTIYITLSDFITTGMAYRIKIPGGGTDEYYILENHQRISQFDVPDNSSSVKGVFVLRQTADIGSAVSVITADGRYDWSVPYTLPNIYGSNPAEIPVFLRGSANRVSGYNHRQFIPWTLGGIQQTPASIHYQLVNGVVVQAGVNGNPAVFTGNGKDQFDLTNNSVFTPSGNPSSDIYGNANKIGFEVTGITAQGIATLDVFINNVIDAAPSSPQNVSVGVYGRTRFNPGVAQVSWSANAESDIASYEIYRSVGGPGVPTFLGSVSSSQLNYIDNGATIGTGMMVYYVMLQLEYDF